MKQLRRHKQIINLFLVTLMAFWQIGQPLQANTLTEQLSASSTNGALITGGTGLEILGGGSIRLTNVLNDYTGVTAIKNGSLIITNPALLGLDSSAISILSTNNTPLNNNLIGFGGGSLVLDGTTAGFSLTRDVDFEGRGPIGDRGSAILSLGNNTLSGILRSSISPLPLSPTATIRNSRINSVNGTLTLSGTVNAGGTAATTFLSLGGVNSAGVSNFNLTGTLEGTGSIEKSGAGTLFLNPSSISGFSGTVRISGSSTGGQQSSVRVTQATVGATSIFGANIGTNASSAIDLNGGVLEFRNDGNLDFGVLSSGKNVYLRANSTVFTGPGVGGAGINGTTTLGTFRVAANTTGTFNSRNGYGVTLDAWTQESANNPNTITNNMGGTLLFTGNAWNNGDATARTLTINGGGNTTINGFINATASAHALSKGGTGVLTIKGQGASTLAGVSVTGGSLAITDFRSINNASTAAISLGNATTTAGNLIIGTDVAPLAAGLATTRPITLNTTTVSPSIYANQSGVIPVTLGGVITRSVQTTGGLFLGGTNTADNTISVVIPNAGTGGVTKLGSGTWVLSAANSYTGATTIQGGTLKLRANAAASNVIGSAATNTVVFNANATTGTAGGTLEFRGFSAAATTETLGPLTPTAGAATVRILGNSAAANLTFTSLGATTAASSVNFDTTNATGGVITLTGAAAATATTLPGTANFQGHLYINGANFANAVAGVVTTPTYAAAGNFQNAGAGLVTGVHNRLTTATASGAETISSLLTNSQTLTLSGDLVVSTGGILQSGGTASILSDSATPRLIQGGAAGTNIAIRVNLGSDVLNLGSATNPVDISSTTTAGLTKNGEGRLNIFGLNAQTGTTTINEGTVTLNGALSQLSATASALVIRQNAVLELNGHTNHQTAALDGAGTIRNVGAVQAQFQQTAGGTWRGVFEDGPGGGGLRVVQGGAAATWSGLNTYSGSTTITGAALLTVDTLANGVVPSGIGQSTNAASNLVFTGTTGGLDYRGSILDGALTIGSRSASTDRLFTLDAVATGATLSSTASNNNAIVWSNTGAIVNNTTANATLTLAGTSTGDNTFNPQLADSSVGGGVTLGLTKAGAGQWNLSNSSNSYTGITTLNDGTLGLNNNSALPTNSPLLLAPTSATSAAILQMSGTFDRNLDATATPGIGTVTFGGAIATTSGGGVGFAAHTTPLIVAIGGVGTPTPLTWGAGGFIGTSIAQDLVLNSTTALSSVDLRNAIDLGASVRTINVLDNGNTGADYATMSGVLSGAGGIRKIGGGVIQLTGASTYTGTTSVEVGTVIVNSLGLSTSPGATSVGDSTAGNTDAGAILLGNAGTGGATLQYVGAGETSDRKIRFNSTTGGAQIHADGAGPLILTNVANDFATPTGAKLLSLRGTNTAGNMITSALTNDGGGGVLSVTVDGGATWILNNSGNTYTGTTTAGAGALGIGDDAALGSGTLVNNNGNVFAHGADRTIANAVTLSNNATNGWLGDFSLTVNGVTNMAAGAQNVTTNNNIVAGEALTFNNGVTANVLTANRAWLIDGAGETIVNGSFTTTTAFGVRFDVTGGGTLNLGTNGATSNFNQSITAVDVDRGTLKFSVDNAIPTTTAAYGGVTLSPELVTGDTATLNLNGTTQTINALTATTDGAVTIDNTSATPGTLRFGANNTVVNINPATTGARTITDSGAGALSIVKLGTTSTTFNPGMTLTYQGTTAVEGGTLTIASAVNGTTGLSVINSGSTLALTGGITTPGAISSIVVNGGSTLSLLDGAGSLISNLTTLNLGAGTGTATLNLNVGDSATDTLTLLTGNSATLANTITFNLTDAGLSPSTTYTLLNLTDGGITAFGIANMIQGATPGGFLGSSFTVNDNLVQFTTGTLITGSSWWNANGALDTWSDVANWAVTDKTGATAAASIPGQGTDVKFIADNIVGGAAITTTLEQNIKINSLTFEPSTNPLDTPISIGIAPGAVATNRLELAPQVATDGLNVQTGATPLVSISAPVRATSDQTWTVADAATLTGATYTNASTTVTVASTAGLRVGMTVAGPGIPSGATVVSIGAGSFVISAATTAAAATAVDVKATSLVSMTGGLSGAGNIIKAGDGKVAVTGASAYTGTSVLINAGQFEIGNGTVLGGIVATPGAGATVNLAGGVFYINNGTSTTVSNNLLLNGGVLSAGGNNHTYSGSVTVGSNSGVNLLDPLTRNNARNVTLSGIVSGSAGLTVDGIPTFNLVNNVSTGNQLDGTLTINNGNSTWNGPLNLTRGTVVFTNAAGGGILTPYAGNPGELNFNQFGRVIYRNVDGATFNRTGTLNFAAAAVGEFQVDNLSVALSSNYTINQQGLTTLGAGSALRILLQDAASALNISDVSLLGTGSISVAGGDADSFVTISGIISDGGGAHTLNVNDDLGAWNQTNTLVRLDGVNTFSGALGLGGGALEFSTVSNIGGPASNLGQGSAINLGGGTLRFIGPVSQTTDRPITQTGAATLGANGTGGATITYTGAITGNGNNLTLDGTGEGFLNGIVTQTGTTADLTKNGTGTWNLNASNALADDIIVTAGTLNINAVNAHQGDDLFIRTGALVNLGVNGALNTAGAGMDALNIAENAASATTSTLDLKGFTSTVGATTIGFENSAIGQIVDSVGGGVLTAASYTVRQGQVASSVTLAGAGGVTKNGAGVFTLSSTNTFAGASTVTEGQLVLDYSTSNTNKIAAAAGLTLGGAAGDANALITFNGNAAATSTQAFTTLTLINGASDFVPVSNGGQAMNVNFTTLTRTAAGGTVDFTIPAVGNITTTQPLTNGILGGYATVNNGTAFATKDGSNNIIPLVATPKDAVGTWLPTDNVIDTAGYSGTLADCAIVNSITFSQPGSTVMVGDKLGITSGGVLVTSGSTGAGISGGQILAATPDLIIHQQAAGDFTIGSAISGTLIVTKTGTGGLVLSGTNTSTGGVNITEGIVKVSGGNAIGDTAPVNFKDVAGSGLTLLGDETVGNLSGNGAAASTIALGSNRLTVNQSTNLVYSGTITGSGTLVKQGTANLNLNGASSSFNGPVIVNQGLLFASGANVSNLPSISSLTVNSGGAFLADNNSGSTTVPDRVNNLAGVTLRSLGGGGFFGIHIRNDVDASANETFGTLTLAGGSSGIAANQNGGTARTSILTFASLVRQDNATIFLNGRNLAVTSGNNRGRITFTAAPTLVGGAGVAQATTAVTNVPIIRFGVSLANTAQVALTDVPNTFASYNANGVVPLNIATEYRLDSAGYTASADANDNLRFTTGATGLATKAFNAVVYDSTAAAMIVSGAGGGTNALTVGSGAMLFTSTVPANGTTLNGFDTITPGTGSSNEWIITVANTTATIGSVLTDGAAATILTKSGSGTLILAADNTYSGGTVFNQGIIQADTLARLGTAGDLRFNGGTLRFGGVFDPTSRNVVIGVNGGVLDTDANNITLANAMSGTGALTKLGTGTLTLNAASTHTGGTTVTDGTLQYGVGIGAALPVASAVTVNGAAAVLDLGANAVSLGAVTLTSGSITGTGSLAATSLIAQGGSIASTLVVAGSTGLIKTGAGTLTLAGANTFSGRLVVAEGVVSFDSIANADGTASALGAPSTPAAGAIRLGAGATAGSLAYTGTGHATDRTIELGGSTGGGVIDASGTGALVLNGAISSEEFGAKTLVLSGTSAPSIDNKITAPITECFGVLTLNKTGSNTWQLDATNSYTGATSVDAGILRLAAAQNLTGALQFGSTNAVTTAGELEVNVSSQFGSLVAQTNSTTNTSLIEIPASQTLTINGAVAIGSAAANSTTLIDAAGAGTLVVNNTTNTGNTFHVGGTGTTNNALADFSDLATMNVSLNTTGGTLLVSSSSGTNATGQAELRLADTTTITANALTVGGGGTYNGTLGQVNQVKLGSTSNTLNVNSLNIGTGARDLGSITFQDSNGTVTVRAADGTAAAAFNMGTGAATTAVALSGNQNTFDVTGHIADLKFSTVNIGTQNRTADLLNVFSFDTGTLEIGTLTASTKGANANTTTTNINIGGGTVTTGAWTLATTTGAGNAVANANLTGGTITFSGAINRGTDSAGGGTATGAVTLNGSNLNMGGNDIGSATDQIVFSAQSGTLSGLSQLNGGGVLDKTTTGTLIMGNGNAYTGGTTVTGGTLLVNNTTGSGTGTGAVTTAATTILGGTGTIAPGSGNGVTTNGTLQIGGATAAPGDDLNITLTSATLTINEKVAFDIFGGKGSGVLNGSTDADRLLLTGSTSGAVALGAGASLVVNTASNTGWTAGSAWQLFDWASIMPTGTFSNLTSTQGNFTDLPDLSSFNLAWNVSNIYTTGTISIVNLVPEPSRLMLLMIGLLGLFFRRRRND